MELCGSLPWSSKAPTAPPCGIRPGKGDPQGPRFYLGKASKRGNCLIRSTSKQAPSLIWAIQKVLSCLFSGRGAFIPKIQTFNIFCHVSTPCPEDSVLTAIRISWIKQLVLCFGVFPLFFETFPLTFSFFFPFQFPPDLCGNPACKDSLVFLFPTKNSPKKTSNGRRFRGGQSQLAHIWGQLRFGHDVSSSNVL